MKHTRRVSHMMLRFVMDLLLSYQSLFNTSTIC